MQKKKPIYNLSASIINTYLFYLKFPTEDSFQSVINRVNKVFIPNKYFDRGNIYEQEVFEGKHGKVSQVVQPLAKQVWGNTYIEFPEYIVFLSGKVDAIDIVNNRIFDLKRTNKLYEDSYKESVQHYFYFYLFPKIKDFYYLIAEGKEKIEEHHIVHIERPSQEELEEKVKSYIDDFFLFLKQSNLWEAFTINHKHKGGK